MLCAFRLKQCPVGENHEQRTPAASSKCARALPESHREKRRTRDQRSFKRLARAGRHCHQRITPMACTHKRPHAGPPSRNPKPPAASNSAAARRGSSAHARLPIGQFHTAGTVVQRGAATLVASHTCVRICRI